MDSSSGIPADGGLNGGLNDVLLSSGEVAKYLRISPSTLAKLRKQGRLRGFKVGSRSYRYSVSDIKAFLAKRSSCENTE